MPTAAKTEPVDTLAPEPSTSTADKSISSVSELAERVSTLTVTSPISESISIPRKPCDSEETLFVVPKLRLGSNSSISPSSVDGMTPHELSLKKIMDLRKLHISPVAQENVEPLSMATDRHVRFHVDLTQALATDSNDHVIDEIKPMETIDYKFIDCELPAAKLKRTMAKMPRITHECQIDIAHILGERLSNRARHTSAFGKVLCSRFRCTNRPQIIHGFNPKHKIVPFRFDVMKRIAPKKTNA